MANKRILVFFISLMIILIIGIGIYWFIFLSEDFRYQNKERVHNICLSSNEVTDYPIDESYNKELKYPKFPLTINVKDKNTNEVKFSFKIDEISKAAHALEMYNCSIYVIRVFNFNETKGLPLPNYRTELWRYNYSGEGEKLLTLFKKEGAPDNYGQDFRIDPFEKYIGLERKYFGHNNYALVIKDLNTKEDIYILSARSIEEQYPNIIGGFNFNMREWSKDGRYFWGDIFDSAYVLVYFRIDTQDWRADIFETPEGAMGGFPLNINTGYVPIQPGQIWTGDYQLTQELKEQYRKEGKRSSLYLYNIFTKEKILVETVDEPLFSFKPRWLSDIELEYYLPSVERKVYKIDER